MPASAFIDQHPLIKCTLIGDGAPGTTTLVGRYAQLMGCAGEDQQRQLLTSFDGHRTLFIDVDVNVTDENEPAQYGGTDAVLVCVSIADASCVEKSLEQLLRYAQRDFPGVPFILVGTEIEHRCWPMIADGSASPRDCSHCPLTAQCAEKLARKFGASRYVECSTATGEGVDDVFEDAYKVALAFVESNKAKYNGNKKRDSDAKKKPRTGCIQQ